MALLFVTACVSPSPVPVSKRIILFRGGTTGAQSQEPVLRVEVHLQPVSVQVVDKKGNDVQGLSVGDFIVLENGKPQKIAFFDTGNGPVSLVVLVDSSNSMKDSNGRLGSAQEIAAQFLRTGRSGDEIFAMDFSDQIGPFQRLTHEQLLNPGGVTLAAAPSNGSALYDAIATALCHLHASKNPRKAVIVISDGVDQNSRITLERLIELVHSSHAQLFMIGLQSRPEFNFGGRVGPKVTLITGRDIDNPVVVFDRLMKESGAESFIPDSERGLESALKAVSNTLQEEYTLAYYPHKVLNRLRRIEVKVKRPGTHVQTRSFVGSDQGPGESVHFDEATCTVSPKLHPYPYESKVTSRPTEMTYREDFSDPHSGWPNHKESHYVSRGYELSNPEVQVSVKQQLMLDGSSTENATVRFRDSIIAAYGPWWSDFHASVTLSAALEKISRKASAEFLHKARPAAGLLFRMNLSGYYALLVSGASNTRDLSVELVRRDFQGSESYAETEIIPWITIAQSTAPETQLAVDATGDEISIFVDNQKVESARDDKYDQGLVGFVISGPGHALFRNLIVEQKQ